VQIKHVKTWDAESGKLIETFEFGKSLGSMQVGLAWGASGPISLSLNGALNFINPNDPKEITTIAGHNSPIYKVFYSNHTKRMYSIGSGETFIEWELGTPKSRFVDGEGHKGIICCAAVTSEFAITASVDSQIRFSSLEKFEYDTKTKLKVEGSPKDIYVASDESFILIGTAKGIATIKNKSIDKFYSLNYEVISVSLNPKDNSIVAVGGSDKKIRVYKIEGDKLKDIFIQKETAHRGSITKVKFSHDGKLLATSDSNREILVWNTEDWTVKYEELVYHSASVTDLDWSSDSKYLASSSLDKCAIIWDLEGKNRIKNICHFTSVKSVAFIDDNTIVTAGDDYCLKTFSFTFKKDDDLKVDE